MRKKNRTNRNVRNSKGISKNEYLLGSNAGRAQNKDLNQDFDYLNKLSAEDFAWLSEFQVAYTSGQLVDEEIMGEDSLILNDRVKSRRPAWRAEKSRRFDALSHSHKLVDYDKEDSEASPFQYSDSYTNMLEEIEESIDAFWSTPREER